MNQLDKIDRISELLWYPTTTANRYEAYKTEFYDQIIYTYTSQDIENNLLEELADG